MRKKIIATLVIAIGLPLSFQSCKEFLDINPLYTQDAENFFETPADYERALIGAYDLLQASFVHLWIGEIASDNAIAGGESVTDTEGLHQIENMSHDATNQELRNVFRWNYAGITRANYILEHENKIDFEGKAEIIAQTKFLRGYYYFQLVKFFGDVPLVVDQRLGAEEVTETERTNKTTVYQQIETDLSAAANTLEWTNPVKGRITKGAALGLLGKVYLYQGKYDQAVTTFDEIIVNGPYSLIADYTELFSVDNENHSEVVFDVQYSGAEGGGYGCLICLEGNAAPGFQGIRQYDGPVYGDGNSYNLPTQDLYDAFNNADPRRDATILDIDEFISQQSNPGSIKYAVGGGGHTGYYNNKYIKRKGEIGLPDNDLTSPVNYLVIRYADVLLMAAEAHTQSGLGSEASAQSYLNQVRTRVGMPAINASGNDLYNAILAERRLELSGEGHRFFDLVRTNRAAQEIEGFIPNKHELFPIPQVEINLAGGNWSQNPGY